MKKLIYVFIISFFPIIGVTQNLEWAQKIGESEDDRCFDMTHDNNGNIYITGGFSNSVNFNPNGTSYYINSSNINNSDIYLAKYDGASNLIWAFSLGNTEWELGLSITTDSLNNVYIIGNYRGNVDFDPSANNYSLNSLNMSYFLAKYDSNGTFAWVKDIGNDGNGYLTLHRTRLYTDDNSNVYTYIHKNDTLKKFDNNGNQVWQKQLNGVPVIGGQQFFYFLNGFKTPFEYEYFYQDSIALNKLDTNGNILSSDLIAKSDDGTVGGFISYDDNGNILLSGTFWGKVEFYSLTDTITIVNYDTTLIGPGVYGPLRKEFIAKVDLVGNTKWVKYFNGSSPMPYMLKTNSNGEIFTLGKSNFSTNFDPSGNVTISTSWNHYIAKYDSLFNYQACSIFLGGSGNDFVGNFKMYDDTALICGHFFNTIDVDLTNSNYPLTASPPEDIFFAKYSNFDITSNLVSIDILQESSNHIKAFPNPTTGLVSVIIEEFSDHSSLMLYNLWGEQLLSKKINKKNFELDLSNYSSGMYYLILLNNKETTSVIKLIKH